MLTHYIERDFEYKGYRCIVLVQLKGFRCGYVGVPPSHELYGVDCSISDFTGEIMCHRRNNICGRRNWFYLSSA